MCSLVVEHLIVSILVYKQVRLWIDSEGSGVWIDSTIEFIVERIINILAGLDGLTVLSEVSLHYECWVLLQVRLTEINRTMSVLELRLLLQVDWVRN